ncbi:hypothetical protein [Lichenibacterium dinghuense]|uniref:hypothetical protein n=1 Tax=Lichenibacterium dinghuense TaxID=2895977 RepID=UPI001F364084|nr:hypothetical protein [Lichenibacterium sp. 6Y81]
MNDPVAVPTVDTQHSVDLSIVEHILASYSDEMRSDALLAIGNSSRKVLGWIVYSSPDTSYCDTICEGSFDITFAASTHHFLVTDIRAAETPSTDRLGGFLVVRDKRALGVKLKATPEGLFQRLLEPTHPASTHPAEAQIRDGTVSPTNDRFIDRRDATMIGETTNPSPFIYFMDDGANERTIFASWIAAARASLAECLDILVLDHRPGFPDARDVDAWGDGLRLRSDAGSTPAVGTHRRDGGPMGGEAHQGHDRVGRLATPWGRGFGHPLDVGGLPVVRTHPDLVSCADGAGVRASHGAGRPTIRRVDDMPDACAVDALPARGMRHHVEACRNQAARSGEDGADQPATIRGDARRSGDREGGGLQWSTLAFNAATSGPTVHSSRGEDNNCVSGMRMHDAGRWHDCIPLSAASATHGFPQQVHRECLARH